MTSIYKLLVLLLTGDFIGGMFGLQEDAGILIPIYWVHQEAIPWVVENPLVVIMAVGVVYVAWREVQE